MEAPREHGHAHHEGPRPPPHGHGGEHEWHGRGEHDWRGHEEHGHGHDWKNNVLGSEAPPMEELRLPDESGWYMPTPAPAIASSTGVVLTCAAVGIFVLGLVLILLMVILYRKRKLIARRQAAMAKAQRNLYVSGMGLDNPTYIVPLNGDDKKLGLDVTAMISAADYPSLLEQCAPPSYQQATTLSDPAPPNYSLEPDDNLEQVPVLRRLSITLPDDPDPNKTDVDV